MCASAEVVTSLHPDPIDKHVNGSAGSGNDGL